uniref:Odorant binding protein n=1 Tax=Heterorhabditis bacteriophora TaxID=37862 RepID=A0A1I7WRD2_HETBA
MKIAYITVMVVIVVVGNRLPKQDIYLGKDHFEKLKNIHFNWYTFSIKALLAQMAKDLMKKLDKASSMNMIACLKKISDTKDISETAKCLLITKSNLQNVKKTYQTGIRGKDHSFSPGYFKVQ